MRVAPEPLLVLMPGLAALGAVASIAAVLWIETEPGQKTRSRRKASIVIRDLESDCLILQDIFRRLASGHRAGDAGSRPESTPLKFGLPAMAGGSSSHAAHQSMLVDVSRCLPMAAENAAEIIGLIEDEEIEAADEVLYGFGECQELLNQVLAERSSIEAGIGAGLDVSGRLVGLVRVLKKGTAA